MTRTQKRKEMSLQKKAEANRARRRAVVIHARLKRGISGWDALSVAGTAGGIALGISALLVPAIPFGYAVGLSAAGLGAKITQSILEKSVDDPVIKK